MGVYHRAPSSLNLTFLKHTEFLYQAKRIRPEQGLALIWPADFTHTHRGNPPLAETKYIVTSWFEFAV